MKVDKEDFNFLLMMTKWLLEDGMVNYTEEDYDNYERIVKKYELEESKP